MIESLCHFILGEELGIFSLFRYSFPIDYDIGIVVIFSVANFSSVLHKSCRNFRRLCDIFATGQSFHLLTAILAIIKIVLFAETDKVRRSRQFLDWRINTISLSCFPLKLLIGPNMPRFVFHFINAVDFFAIWIIFCQIVLSELRFHNQT